MQIPGQKEKLFELQKAWAVALSGRPRVVFVEGHDDVAKSALVDAFFEMIRGQTTTDKPALVGRGRCFEIDEWSEPLRPAWDALCEVLGELVESGFEPDFASLPAVAELSSIVPDTHIATAGLTLAAVLSDEPGQLRIPREHYLESPDLVLRDAMLTLTSEWPVALFFEGLELADASTLAALTDLLDILWEHDQPFYFLLVLACDPEVGRSRRVIDRIEELLERYDRPKNRILTRVRLKGAERAASCERLDDLDSQTRQLLAAASTQGRRFSPATLLSVVGRDELFIAAKLHDLCERGILREASGPAVFELFGGSVFEFVDPGDVETLRASMTAGEQALYHGRIADHLLDERARIRLARDRLGEPEGSGYLTQKLAGDKAKLETAFRTTGRMLLRHLHGAGRALEATQFLDDACVVLDKAAVRGKFAAGERTRQTRWLSHIAEDILLSLVRLQPQAAPAQVARASYDAACAAAQCRLALGEEFEAEQLFERALDFARFLGDEELECRILHHVHEPTKEMPTKEIL